MNILTYDHQLLDWYPDVLDVRDFLWYLVDIMAHKLILYIEGKLFTNLMFLSICFHLKVAYIMILASVGDHGANHC